MAPYTYDMEYILVKINKSNHGSPVDNILWMVFVVVVVLNSKSRCNKSKNYITNGILDTMWVINTLSENNMYGIEIL